MTRHVRLAATVVVGALLALPGAAGAPLDGRWRLTAQSYEEGRADLVREGLSLELVFGGGSDVRVVDPGDGRAAREAVWPAVFTDEGPAPVEVISREIDPSGGAVRATYRIAPPDGEGWTLDLTESYALDEAGDLVGTLAVRMTRDGEPAGGYTLRRTFERVGP